MKELKHLHLMVRAEITKPIQTEEEAKTWMKDLLTLSI